MRVVRLNAQMKIAGFCVVAALTGWLVRGIRFDAPPEPVRTAQQPVVVASDPLPDPPSLIQHAPLDASPGKRNLFAYREEEHRIFVAPPALEVAPVAIAPVPVVVETPQAPALIPFPYRYIGTFGTAQNRVAAFVRDGEITTVRVGDRIGEFVLRSIDLETVQVEGPDGVRRVPMSASV